MSRRQLYPVNIANPATFTRCDLYGVYIYFIPRTPPYIIYGVRVRGIKHPCPKGVNAAGNPGELADYKPRETADSRQATARTRTGLHALDAEPCRRADQDGRTPHGARTRGWRRHTGGSRVLPANRAVGHTDEVRQTMIVTIFWGRSQVVVGHYLRIFPQ